MAVTVTYGDAFLAGLWKAEHNIESETVKVALMDTTFAFDSVNHDEWADVSVSEIAGGFGYTTGGQTVTNLSVSVTAGVVTVSADNATWTATGGAIADTGSAIVYSDTHAYKRIIMCIDFGVDYGTPDGKQFQINFSAGFAKSQQAAAA
jgi:hypothetical protein